MGSYKLWVSAEGTFMSVAQLKPTGFAPHDESKSAGHGSRCQSA